MLFLHFGGKAMFTRISVIILIVTLAVGCSSIFESKNSEFELHTNKPLGIIYRGDSLSVWGSRTMVYPRSSHNLSFTVIDDTSKYEVVMKPFLSDKFLYMNLIGFGFGHIYDLLFCDFDKLFSYDREIYLYADSNGLERYRFGYPQDRAGKYRLVMTIPEGNHFYYRSPSGQSSSAGFMLGGIGLERYFNKDWYGSLIAEFKTDFMIPFPAPVDYEGEYERVSNFSVSAMLYRDFDWVHLGGGLAFSRYFDVKRNTLGLAPEYSDTLIYYKAYSTVALPVAVKIPCSEKLYLGLFYSPSFISFGRKTKLEYSHTLNFSFIFNIGMF